MTVITIHININMEKTKKWSQEEGGLYFLFTGKFVL